MATRTNDRRRIVKQMRAVELMLADLPELAGEWEQLSIDEQISWSLDWGNEMAGLKDLAAAAAHGDLNHAHQARYQSLVHRLCDALPLIDRLGLRQPPLPTGPGR